MIDAATCVMGLARNQRRAPPLFGDGLLDKANIPRHRGGTIDQNVRPVGFSQESLTGNSTNDLASLPGKRHRRVDGEKVTRLENAIEHGDGSVRPRAGTSFHLSTSAWRISSGTAANRSRCGASRRPTAMGTSSSFSASRMFIAAGDVITMDRYPFIDAKSGGSIQGIIDALNWIVATAVPEYNLQGGTRVIPGHGRILNQTDVVEYRDMATIVRNRIAMLGQTGQDAPAGQG